MTLRVELPGGGPTLTLHSVEDLDRHQRDLERAYRTGEARCFCVPAGLPLAICRLRAQRKVRYYLRAHPSLSAAHAPECLFGPNRGGARVVVPVEDGLLHLEGGLRKNDLREAAQPSALYADRSPSLAQTTYLALLRDLVGAAHLNVYEPLRPQMHACAAWSALLRCSHRRTAEGDLFDLFLAMPPGGDAVDQQPLVDHARAVIDAAQSTGSRVVLLAEVGALDMPSGVAAKMFVKNLERQTGWHAAWRAEVARALIARFHVAASMVGAMGARVVVCGACDLDPKTQTLWLRYGAILPLCKPFMPVESSYELDLARRLMREGRAFRKPLAQGEDEFVPDFELLDVGAHPMPLEVFGMNAPAYVARMREKYALYDARFGKTGWWCWHAITQKGMPPLPPRREGAASSA